MTKIEFLYFDGCPNSESALENLKSVLAEENINASLEIINVQSNEQAEKFGFQGSPSIRINGQDIEGRNEGHAYSCRVYEIDSESTGIPTKDFIRNKVLGLIK